MQGNEGGMKGKGREMTDSDKEINGREGRCREMAGKERDITPK